MPVYEGRVRIIRDVTIGQPPELAPLLAPDRSVSIEGAFRYQACDDEGTQRCAQWCAAIKQCRAPRTLVGRHPHRVELAAGRIDRRFRCAKSKPGEQQHEPRGPDSSPDAELPPREEWLIAEWLSGAEKPIGYWLSNLPADTTPERLARLARLRWRIELDYKQLKGELGLDHYEGRSWLGWYHHTALVTAAHGFLTLERLNPFHPRPA